MAPAATAAIEALLQALGGRPGASAAELADGAGIGCSVANKLLVKLAAEGRVARKAGGRRDGRRRPDRWTLLAPAPTQLAKDPDLPPTTPHPSIPDGAAVGSSAPPARRLGAGELRRLVLAYLSDRPQQALSPTAIATALDRSAGAVANALAVLASQGAVAQTQATPRRHASRHDHSPTHTNQ
jgi:hypothetical protein